jgi:uncharacterized protein YeaO (DUF488 family)
MGGNNGIEVKRVYDDPETSDGARVLVDRLWPRGVSKDDAELEEWLKELAPTDELRQWFNHETEKWDEFIKRYHRELETRDQARKELKKLRELMKDNTVTLLYAAKDTAHNNAVALRDYLISGNG